MKTFKGVLAGVIFALLAVYLWDDLPPEPLHVRQAKILDVICQLESGCDSRIGRGANGEVGPYQISLAYFQDSMVAGDWGQCQDPRYSRRVVKAYMRRWVPTAWELADAEVVLRTHHGGPRGFSKASTLPYWDRGRRLLGLQ